MTLESRKKIWVCVLAELLTNTRLLDKPLILPIWAHFFIFKMEISTPTPLTSWDYYEIKVKHYIEKHVENWWLQVSLQWNTDLISHLNICWFYFWPMNTFGDLVFKRCIFHCRWKMFAEILHVRILAIMSRCKSCFLFGSFPTLRLFKIHEGFPATCTVCTVVTEVKTLVLHPLHHGSVDLHVLDLLRWRLFCGLPGCHDWKCESIHSSFMHLFIYMINIYWVPGNWVWSAQMEEQKFKNEDKWGPIPSWGRVSSLEQEIDMWTKDYRNITRMIDTPHCPGRLWWGRR